MHDGSPAERVAIALLHHPVYDKNRQVVTTAVTNLDIHDIARASRTFGLSRYFIVTPVAPDAIRLAPPLVVTTDELDLFVDALPGLLDAATAPETSTQDAR